jgi:hypothetical protein
MGLFRRRVPTPTSTTPTGETRGLRELAESRGWQPIEGDPFDGGVTDNLWRLNFALYGQREPIGNGAADTIVRRSTYHETYAGTIEGRRLVVTNHSTNIAQLRLYDFEAVAVCSVALGTISPVMLIQPRAFPLIARHVPTTASGDAAFDDRFVAILAPTVGPEVLTDDVRRLLMTRDDWALLGNESSLLCVSRGRYESSDAITRRIDETMSIVHAFPASVVPATIDRSVDDLAARIEKISSIDEALAFLEQLSADDRQRLAQSNTPLAAFADVTTPEQAMQKFESLDVQQRMQLLGMFQRIEDQ